MKLSELFRLSRKERDLSLVQLSQLSGISYSMLYRLEEGDIAHPHPDILRKIAPPLLLDYEDLLHVAGYLDTSPSFATQCSRSSKQQQDTQRIPIFNWSCLKDLNFKQPLHSNKWLDFNNTSYHTFATYLPADFKHALFLANQLIVIEHLDHKHLKAGQMVLIYNQQQLYIDTLMSFKNELFASTAKEVSTFTNMNKLNILGRIICQFFNHFFA